MAALRVVRSVTALRRALEDERLSGQRIGFVPTMGALHAGHASLVQHATQVSDVVVSSIFVNPLQFGPKEDLAHYPRTPEADMALLEAAGCRVLFLPEVSEVYPQGFCTTVHLPGLSEVLCGRSRPGHFSGVLTVVLKLLNMVQPDVACFGRKDFQQALLIARMVRDFNLPVQVEVCPTLREADGLAMSSRNRYLSAEERVAAPALRAAVLAMDAAFRAGERAAASLLALGRARIATVPRFALDYLELRNPQDLSERDGAVKQGDLVAVAAQLGSARLIDNGLLGTEEAP